MMLQKDVMFISTMAESDDSNYCIKSGDDLLFYGPVKYSTESR